MENGMGWMRAWWKVVGRAAWWVAVAVMAGVMGWSFGPRPWGMVGVEGNLFSVWVVSVQRGRVEFTQYQQLVGWKPEELLRPMVVTFAAGGGGGATPAVPPRHFWEHQVVTEGRLLGFEGSERIEWSARPSISSLVVRGTWVRSMTVPLWPVCAVLAWPVVRRLARRAGLARIRRRAGLCAGCGYDLRESGERCSECGLLRGEVGWWERWTVGTGRVTAAGWVVAKRAGRLLGRAAWVGSWAVVVLGSGLWGVSWIQPTDVVWQWGRQCEVTVDRGRVEVRWAERFSPAVADAEEALDLGYRLKEGDAGTFPAGEVEARFSEWPRVYATCHVEGWRDWAPSETVEEAAERGRGEELGDRQVFRDFEQWRVGPVVHGVRECWDDGWFGDSGGRAWAEREARGAKAMRVWVWGSSLWVVVAAGVVWPVVRGVVRGFSQRSQSGERG